LIDPCLDNWRRLTVKEDWQRFVEDDPPASPKRLGRAAYKRMNAGERDVYDERRMDAAHQLVVAGIYQPVHRMLWRLMRSNQFRGPGARHGAMVDGGPGNGKSTLIAQFARVFERLCRGRYPHELRPNGHEYHPALFINADAYPSPKSFNKAILNFYGLNPKYGDTHDYTQLLLNCVDKCGTRLIVIDDAHLIQLHRINDRDANNHLKRLANETRATMVYAGIELENTGFMHEGLTYLDAQLVQISQRFKRVPVGPMQRSTRAGRELFLGVLAVYERELVLLAYKEGDLTGIADYLWHRTRGVIGSLSQLLLEGMVEAIDTGKERLTKRLLDGIDIGYAAEVASGRHASALAA
jgi:hypothetical protein